MLQEWAALHDEVDGCEDWIEMDFHLPLDGTEVWHHPDAWGEDYQFGARALDGTTVVGNPQQDYWDFTLRVPHPDCGPFQFATTPIQLVSDDLEFTAPVSLVLCRGPWYSAHRPARSACLYTLVDHPQPDGTCVGDDAMPNDEYSGLATETFQFSFRVRRSGGDHGGNQRILDPEKPGDD
jgi:hypothetical protein